jgi:formylglycine-generating enzyme required for sulfatase activity
MTRKVRIPQYPPQCPAWAGGFGVDRYGVFADLIWGEAVQRVRWIEPGGFNMGASNNELGSLNYERPRHWVTVKEGFWIGETPVTQAFYEAITKRTPSDFKGEDLRPVDSVTWYESRELCNMLTASFPEPNEWHARLPSEAEWEYACRAGTTEPLYSEKPLTSKTGRCSNMDELAWYDKNSSAKTHPTKEKAANPWGLYDMLGNVWEWCEDHWHDSYNGAPGDARAWVDETAEEGRGRVFRGGSWDSYAGRCRSAIRSWDGPGFRSHYRGFRLVLAPSSTSLKQARRGERAPSAVPQAEPGPERQKGDRRAE